MPSRKILLPVFATLFVSVTAFAADFPAPPPDAPRPPAAADRAPRSCFTAFRDLSPEARIIRAQQIQKDADTLTVTKFHEARKAECDKLATMTPDDRKKFADSLQAKWDALTSDQKLKLYHETLLRHDRMAHHWLNRDPGAGLMHPAGRPGMGWAEHHRSRRQTP